jgi:predicted  nucleic acid-binding Zn-ribbon protein
MDDLRALNQLQNVDLQLQALEEEMSEVRRKLTDEGDLPKIKGQLVKIEAILADRSAKHRSGERKIETLVGSIKDIDRRLYGGSVTNVKELDALGEQRQFSAEQRAESEDVLLDLMVEIDDFESARDRHVKAIERLTGSRENEVAGLKAREPLLAGEIKDMTGDRREQASELPATLVARYETLRKRKGGRAVASLDGHLCSVCRVELPVGDLGRAKAGQEVVQCNSCRRIIYAG